MQETIRSVSGQTIGTITTLSNGDKEVKDFYGRILGYYRKSQDATIDFYGRILYRGDMASALLIIIKP